MKKLIVYCAASALLGGAVAGRLLDSRTNLLAPASAQELRAPVHTSIPLASASLPPNPGLTQEELTNIRVYDGANRGVVNVLTKTVSHDRFFMLATPAEGAGSGSVLDKQGHILTNYHVVEDANKVWVTLPGGKDSMAREPRVRIPAARIHSKVKLLASIRTMISPSSRLPRHPRNSFQSRSARRRISASVSVSIRSVIRSGSRVR